MKIVMPRFRTPIPWSKIILEFFSVLLAVFLAFVLNEWRNDRSDKATARLALQSIQEEMNKNLRFLERNNPYHDSLYMFMREQEKLLAEEKMSKEELVIFQQRIPVNIIAMNDNAWNATVETRAISYLPFELAEKLSVTYHLQQEYNELVHAFFENIFTNLDFYTGEKAPVFYLMITLFGNMVQVEEQLIERYREMDQQIRIHLD